MSQENVDLVRRQTAAFNARDVPALEALYTEDCVVQLIGGMETMAGSEFRGREASLGYVHDLVETVGMTLEIEEIREVGDQVLMITTVGASGAASHAGATVRIANVYTFRDGKISINTSYYSVEEALKAVGLEE
jgi:ketosteroid isomerase-like protein